MKINITEVFELQAIIILLSAGHSYKLDFLLNTMLPFPSGSKTWHGLQSRQ